MTAIDWQLLARNGAIKRAPKIERPKKSLLRRIGAWLIKNA